MGSCCTLRHRSVWWPCMIAENTYIYQLLIESSSKTPSCSKRQNVGRHCRTEGQLKHTKGLSALSGRNRHPLSYSYPHENSELLLLLLWRRFNAQPIPFSEMLLSRFEWGVSIRMKRVDVWRNGDWPIRRKKTEASNEYYTCHRKWW